MIFDGNNYLATDSTFWFENCTIWRFENVLIWRCYVEWVFNVVMMKWMVGGWECPVGFDFDVNLCFWKIDFFGDFSGKIFNKVNEVRQGAY